MPQFYRAGTEPLDDLLRQIGSNVRSERVLQSLNQRQLAEKSGVAQGNISAIENGRIDIQIGTLFKISEALGTSFSTLTAD